MSTFFASSQLLSAGMLLLSARSKLDIILRFERHIYVTNYVVFIHRLPGNCVKYLKILPPEKIVRKEYASHLVDEGWTLLSCDDLNCVTTSHRAFSSQLLVRNRF